MQKALDVAIHGGMKFGEDDISILYSKYRAGRWMTNGGEGWYMEACGGKRGTDNLSAAISFEKAWGRPAWLWAEKTSTPERLHVGAVFTWKGVRVKVTSFNDKDQSLVACTYKGNSLHYDRYREGQKEHEGMLHWINNEYRQCEVWKKTKGGFLICRFGPPVKYDTSSIEKRFKITFVELMEVRKAYDAKRRKHEKALKAVTTLDQLESATRAASDEGQDAYRHFDIEILRDLAGVKYEELVRGLSPHERLILESRAATTREKAQREALDKWLAGEDVQISYFAHNIQCRIFKGKVQVTNGNSVTLAGARMALAFALEHRKTGWERTPTTEGAMCDGHEIMAVTSKAVVIGCTMFLWKEIDRLAPQLQSA